MLGVALGVGLNCVLLRERVKREASTEAELDVITFS
jgi:hypothetical protein